MSGISHFSFPCLLMMTVCASSAIAGEPTIKFDVPAIVCVHEIEFQDASSNESKQSSNPPGNRVEKIVEVVVPVSTEIAPAERDMIDEFRFDVFWNRNAYPLVDYGPKTQTVSNIEGLISIEKSEAKNNGLGINLGGSYEAISGGLKADTASQKAKTVRYQEVPEHDVLVASGTVRRGTGAFFRFHPSRTETLEGGRELVLAFRVPQSWRGGILKVECRALGRKKVFPGWSEPFESNRAFIVPIHIEGDEEARRAATDLIQSEQDLRASWNRFERTKKRETVRVFTFAQSPPLDRTSLPENWIHHLIQSGTNDYFTHYEARLPDSLRSTAASFVESRQAMLTLSR